MKIILFGLLFVIVLIGNYIQAADYSTSLSNQYSMCSLTGLNYTGKNKIIVDKVINKLQNILDTKLIDNQQKLLLIYRIVDKINDLKRIKPQYKTLLDLLKYKMENDLAREYNFWHIDLHNIRIVDGDTISFRMCYDTNKYKLRFIGIDAPESNPTRYGYIECYGNEAKEHLKSLLTNSDIIAAYIEVDPTQGAEDKYGRILGYLRLVTKDGNTYVLRNINYLQIRDGYAWQYLYKLTYKYYNLFVKAEKEAKEKNRGLWSPATCNGQRINISEQGNIRPEGISQSEWMLTQGDEADSCPKKITCSQIKNCDMAYYYLNTCHIKSLDRNGDGVPCENLCIR